MAYSELVKRFDRVQDYMRISDFRLQTRRTSDKVPAPR